MNNNCIIKFFKKIVSFFNSDGTTTTGDNTTINATEMKGGNSSINVTKGDNSPIIRGDKNVYKK
jgi:hypothetical protein